jgi:hypothetical protein
LLPKALFKAVFQAAARSLKSDSSIMNAGVPNSFAKAVAEIEEIVNSLSVLT